MKQSDWFSLILVAKKLNLIQLPEPTARTPVNARFKLGFRAAHALIAHRLVARSNSPKWKPALKARPDFATPADSKISGFARPHGSKLFADSKISSIESGFKKLRIRMRIRWIRVDGRRIRKDKLADSKISGYVWTGP